MERGLGGKYKADGDGYYVDTPLGKFRPVDIVDGKLKVITQEIAEKRYTRQRMIEGGLYSRGYPTTQEVKRPRRLKKR